MPYTLVPRLVVAPLVMAPLVVAPLAYHKRFPRFSRYYTINQKTHTKTLKSLIFFSLLLISPALLAQPELQSHDDGVYRDYIRSVRMHVTGLFLSLPVAVLGQQQALYLSFDELDGRGTRYYYTVIHCDRD